MIRDRKGEEYLEMTEAAPNRFEDAIAAFLGFLERDKVANHVEWIFPEDLQVLDGRFYVREPLSFENLDRAGAKYRDGLERGLGIELSVICWKDDCACSSVYVPQDDQEAALRLMPVGLPTRLKLSYPINGGWNGEPQSRDERRNAVPVRGRLRWFFLRRKAAENEAMKMQLFS